MKKITQILITLTLSILIAINSYAHTESFDVSKITGITEEQLQEICPKWCNDYCANIAMLSFEYQISAEFAITVFRYEYIADRKSVGGFKDSDNKYIVYDDTLMSIYEWFDTFSKTYMNTESWHYSQTKGTTIYDIAPLYNQGKTEYDDLSKNWYDTIERETLAIIDKFN